MILKHTCEHGTRTVEFDEGREGIGSVRSLAGRRSFAQETVRALMPSCPICEQMHVRVELQQSPPQISQSVLNLATDERDDA